MRPRPCPASGRRDRSLGAFRRARHTPPLRLRRTGPTAAPLEECSSLSTEVAARRRRQWRDDLKAAAAGRLDADLALKHLEAMRWLDSSVYHVWRAVHHLATRGSDTQTELRD